MIKTKKKTNRDVQVTGISSKSSPETGRREKQIRRAPEVAENDSRAKKKRMISAPAVPALKEPQTVVSSSVSGAIQIGGGLVDCKGLERAISALSRHVKKLHQQNETPNLLADSGGPTVSLMFSLQNIPDRQRIIPHVM